MKETGLDKRSPLTKREKTQYVLAFGVVAVLLYAIGFPIFLLFFFGILAFFIWKAFTAGTRNETRAVFEFYLSTNEIIRDDGRSWYGFEMQEAIAKGEAIIREMPAAPPLVHFCLGALYQKIGDHASAIRHLSHLTTDNSAQEAAIVYPNKELREYVRVLRKIESTPTEAPRTSSAVRSLERARRKRANDMLAFSESIIAGEAPKLIDGSETSDPSATQPYNFAEFAASKKKAQETPPENERRTISEVLHDIYDENTG